MQKILIRSYEEPQTAKMKSIPQKQPELPIAAYLKRRP
jgi:hypothetical protein